MRAANPQILVSVIMRELAIDADEAVHHLDRLEAMDLVKYKGTVKGAVELTRSGLTTTMKMANAQPPVDQVKAPERV